MGPFTHTIRLLRRSPGFSAVVILTLAIGIGANGTIFSVVRSVLYRPMPFANGDRVVTVTSDNLERGWLDFGVSLPDLVDWQTQSHTVDQVAGYWAGTGNLTGGDRPTRVAYGLATPDLFGVLGTPPLMGRTFTAEENDEGRDGVVVLSWPFWQSAMGGRPDILGETVFLDRRRLEVIGVMPRGFAFPEQDVAFWKPFGFQAREYQRRGARWLGAVAALSPTRTMSEAQTEFDQIATQLALGHPRSNKGWTTSVFPYRATLTANVRSLLFLGWAAVGIVLLIASANVANLFLARASKREQEFAVRAALGAGRSTLVKQLLGESLVFATLGGVLGMVLVVVGVSAFGRIAPEDFTIMGALTVDWVVAAYSAGLVLLTGILFGMLPAVKASRPNLDATLRQAGRGGMATGSHRLRGALVVAEVALAAIVLVGAGLTIRSFGRLLSVDPGFETDGRLTLKVAPSRAAFPERSDAVAFYDELISGMRQLPGVAAAAAVSVLPVPGGSWWTSSFWPEGKSYGDGETPVAATRIVAGEYFETMGIPLLRGRTFNPNDAEGERVLVIDRMAAEQYWPGEDPLGRLVTFDRPSGEDVTWYRIVGIVGAVRHEAVEVAPTPMAYMTLAQAEFGHFLDWGMSMVVRTPADPLALAPPVRAIIAAQAPDLPVYNVQLLTHKVADNLAERRFTLTMLSVFGGISLLLAAIGVYAVLATMVAERTREIGMRMALGADRKHVLYWVLRDGAVKAGAGLAIGLVIALASSRLMTSLVYQVSGTDPVTYGGIAIVLGGVALVASIVPAWRATRVDPMEALRSG
jgi:predicted permease